MFMLTSNLFRALHPLKSSDAESFDLDEEEPNLEPAWPHLQVQYSHLLSSVSLLCWVGYGVDKEGPNLGASLAPAGGWYLTVGSLVIVLGCGLDTPASQGTGPPLVPAGGGWLQGGAARD